jgi:hypothetical protein
VAFQLATSAPQHINNAETWRCVLQALFALRELKLLPHSTLTESDPDLLTDPGVRSAFNAAVYEASVRSSTVVHRKHSTGTPKGGLLSFFFGEAVTVDPEDPDDAARLTSPLDDDRYVRCSI